MKEERNYKEIRFDMYKTFLFKRMIELLTWLVPTLILGVIFKIPCSYIFSIFVLLMMFAAPALLVLNLKDEQIDMMVDAYEENQEEE